MKEILNISLMLLFYAGGQPYTVSDYIISTIAGGMKSVGDEREGGPAEQAYFGSMLGLTVAPNGAIYVADPGRHRICKITPDGKMFKVAGRGSLPEPCCIETSARKGYQFRVEGKAAFIDGEPASTVDLDFPIGVAIDMDGNTYISDASNNRINKVDKAGLIYTIAGDGLPGYSGDGGPAKQARLHYPTGIAVDNLGNLYIADSANNRIRMIDSKGMIQTIAGNGKSKDSKNGDLAIKASLKKPSGVAVNANNIVYIADSVDARIKRINRDGRIEFVAGTGRHEFVGDEIPAIQSGLFAPSGIAIDAADNLYIAETGRVRKIDRNGIIHTIAGGVTAARSRHDGVLGIRSYIFPDGIAVDAAGKVYIADQGTIRRLTADHSQ